MKVGDKVRLLVKEYESYGYYLNHFYEVCYVNNENIQITRNDFQTPCWVKFDELEEYIAVPRVTSNIYDNIETHADGAAPGLGNEFGRYAECVGGCGKEAWTVDFYCTDVSGECPGPKNKINISGERLMEITGAKRVQQSARYNQGKVQTREIDPAFVLGIGEVLTKSREKYEHYNWCKPTKLSTPYESMMRHILAFQSGENIDPDDGCSHLLKAAVNIMFMHYHITNNPEESDDRFFKKDKK